MPYLTWLDRQKGVWLSGLRCDIWAIKVNNPRVRITLHPAMIMAELVYAINLGLIPYGFESH